VNKFANPPFSSDKPSNRKHVAFLLRRW
jgi:hypothetical protein